MSSPRKEEQILMYDSLYGNFRTRTFADIFNSAADFYTFYSSNGAIPALITEASCKTLWALLYSRYGNNTIRSSDENRFKFQVMSLAFQYGPTWEKKLELQASIRALTDDDIRQGTTVINGHGINPSTLLSDSDIEDAGVNDYSRQKYTKSPLDAYATVYSLLEDDVTEEFIMKFSVLFRTIALPDAPLYYEDPNITEEE